VPRVSDVALNIIEAVSRCKFHRATWADDREMTTVERRDRLTEHITQWWRENKGKSVAEGIRTQIPHGDSYTRVTMAENLIRVAGETRPEDREYGLGVLRNLSKDPYSSGAAAANALAKYGDFSPVEEYYEQFGVWLNTRGRLWDGTLPGMFYLAEHGGRKEWELLCKVAAHDIESANEGKAWGRHAYVLRSLVNASRAQSSPYAIPLLGMALSDKEMTGSRWINEKIGGQSFSKADQATEYLQMLTGTDFGYHVDGTSAERIAAIERAQKWWTDEGKAKYTFDYIEKNMKPSPGKIRAQ